MPLLQQSDLQDCVVAQTILSSQRRAVSFYDSGDRRSSNADFAPSVEGTVRGCCEVEGSVYKDL